MSRVYLDTMVWIYALEADEDFGMLAQDVLRHLRAGGHSVLASPFTLAELLVYPERDGNVFLSALYQRALRAADVETVPFDSKTALEFARIRAALRVSAADAIHLASAVRSSADFFITADVQLLRHGSVRGSRLLDLRKAAAEL